MCKQIWFINEITDKIIYKSYIYLNVCKQITYIKLLLLPNSTWKYLTLCKKWALARLKI